MSTPVDQLQYIYSKRRKEFGRKCNFKRNKTNLVVSIAADANFFDQNYILTDPVERASQTMGGEFSECDQVQENLNFIKTNLRKMFFGPQNVSKLSFPIEILALVLTSIGIL